MFGGSIRGFQALPSFSRSGFHGQSLYRFRGRLYITANSPLRSLAIRLARRLPTNYFQKLTPQEKIAFYFPNIGGLIPNSAIVNGIIQGGKLESPLWQRVSAVTGIDAIASLAVFTTLWVSQHSAKVTPVNAWRQFLWGGKAAKRGRPSSEERIVNAVLRGQR